jgi:uncharacterized membrane protein
MMRRWMPPLVLGIVLAFVAYQVTLAQAPRVLMAAAMARLTKGGGPNAFIHAPLATEKSRAIVRPSPDLAYSSCVIDLSKGPVLVTVAAVPARYWSLSVFDSRTDVAFVRNNVDARGDSLQLIVTREGQVPPPGSTSVRLNGAHAIALIRILIDDRATFPIIDRARRAAECRPLDA